MYNDDVWGRSGPQSALNITEPVKAKRIRVSMRSSAFWRSPRSIPFRYLIQHLGGPNEEYDERKVDAAFSSLEELTVFARQRGVEILLENIPNGFSSSSDFAMFLDVDASRSELLLRYGPRAHHGRRRERVSAA